MKQPFNIEKMKNEGLTLNTLNKSTLWINVPYFLLLVESFAIDPDFAEQGFRCIP